MNAESQNAHDDLPAPARLAEAVAALHKERVFVPPQVDDAILAQARAHLARVARRKTRQPALLPWMAAAASVMIGVWVSQTLLHHRTVSITPLVREDVNGDGRVDILDAFMLARQIERGPAGQADFNQDGRVDKGDVDVLAARAVKLEKGS